MKRSRSRRHETNAGEGRPLSPALRLERDALAAHLHEHHAKPSGDARFHGDHATALPGMNAGGSEDDGADILKGEGEA